MKRTTTIITAALFAITGIGFAAPASADTCRESIWGEDIWGNKRYDCSDGSYKMKNPFNTDRLDDPWATYEFESNSYGSDTWSGKCKYTSFRNSYECRGQYNNRFGSNDFYGSDDFYGSGW